MNKKIIITIFLVLFIFGCQLRRDRQASTEYTRYHQGTQGLELRFMPTAPPPVVYDQPNAILGDRDEINVLVEIRNKGAFDIGTTIADRYYGFGYLLLHGYDETIIRNLKPSFVNKIYLDELSSYGEGIEGKSKYNIEGGYAVIEYPPKILEERSFTRRSQRSHDIGTRSRSLLERFLGSLEHSSIQLPQGVDYYRPNLVATACYEYMTEASPQVCIDPDPYVERTDKSCRVGGITSGVKRGAKGFAIEGISGGQGAPVTVTSIEETAMPGRADFKIYISNTGGGEVMHLDAIYDEACGFPQLLTYRDFDYVHYIVSMNDPTDPLTFFPWNLPLTVQGRKLKCEPKSPVRLDATGRAIIHCTTADFDFFGKSAYKTPLNIRLRYGYMSSTMKQIEIRSTT